ncbi:MAG: Plasmid stabilization system [Candidatus Kaiserbacteria bacterium GW2011_GWA2_49_19]|uniref:Plasmid stabilization system n=2 Tax=Candidatus Kaiseribacteriota TaxID=1752734 RepID=A0A0G1VNX9_9BACT|nr:MAG: Plasmid stabilization system [Candidatus Kaiserbacteria bacterium GW2011_GWA2_49_19]OGG60849.1 MAG: hypothetical protein A3C86_00225 [Candidatus Kaiserbacteria bacterium RIFCSPHIGHO2_02_FULL_49_16]
MRVRYTDTAFSELKEIQAHIAKDNIIAAKIVIGRIERIVERIGEFPEIATPIDASGIRVFPVPPFPYLIFYALEEEGIIIRNIRHASRDRNRFLT